MAAVATQNISGTGLTPAYTAVTASDTIINNGNSYLHVKNGGGSPDTVTITAATACNQGSLHNFAVVVAAGAEGIIGPFPMVRFGAGITVTHSFITSVTQAHIALPA